MDLSMVEWNVIALSLKVAALASALCLPPSLFLGWLFARRDFPGKTALATLVHLPMVLPPVTVGFLLLLVFGIHGPVGRLVHDWFGVRIAFTMAAAIIASAIVALPLCVRSIQVAMEMCDRRLEEAARTLGCSPLAAFVRVTLPGALPGIAAGTVLAFVRSLGEFGATITFAGNIENQTRTLPMAIYSIMNVPGQDAAANGLAVVSVLLAVGAFALSEWLNRRMRAGKAASCGL